MRRLLLHGAIAAMVVTALASIVLMPATGVADHPAGFAACALVTAVIGACRVRFPKHGIEFSPTHPLIFCAMAYVGPMSAVLTALAGVAGSLVARRRIPRADRLLFNLASVTLATAASHAAFAALGGSRGAGPAPLALPLCGAAVVFFAINSGLVSLVVSIDRGRPILAVWTDGFLWTAVVYLSGVPVALALIIAVSEMGPAGAAVAFPAIWLMHGCFAARRSRPDSVVGTATGPSS